MKRNLCGLPNLVFVVLTAVSVLSLGGCAGAPSAQDVSEEPSAEESAAMEERARAVLEEWMEAVNSQDIEKFMSLYSEDALSIDCRANGVLDVRRGKDEIREFMTRIFDEYGDFLSEYQYPSAEYRYDEVTDTPQMNFDRSREDQWELVRFEEKNGELKVKETFLYHRFFEGHNGDGPRIGELTAWADDEGNGDGFLQPEEQLHLLEAVRRVMGEPHDEENFLDEFFSWNDDGYLDELENEIARTVLVRNRLRRIDLFDEELARHRLPPADEERIGLHQANWVNGAAFREEWAASPGPVENENQRLIDFNEDDMLSPFELEVYQDIVLRTAAVNPAPVLYEKYMPAFVEDIYRWADADRNGELDRQEINEVGFVLFESVVPRYGMPTWTPVERFFDRNRDAELKEVEKEWALDFAVEFLLRTAVEEEVRVWDWHREEEVSYRFDTDGSAALSGEELEQARRFITSFEEEFWQGEDPDATEQRWIDSDGNGTVDEWEPDLVRDKMFQAMFLAWIRMPDQQANSLRVRSALEEAADRDGDGMLSMAERDEMIGTLSDPREVSTPLENELDFDGNGEVSRDELVQAKDTGYIPLGEVSAERRIASLSSERRTAAGAASASGGSAGRSSEGRGPTGASAPKKQTRVKAVSSWGSSLAVLGVRDMTEKMAEGQTDLLVSFLENAFVNYGNVTVVDRQNLEKIMEEYKYQTSALVDEETAVEIGKLSGADAIAIGNLSLLADTFYLHLKVINVQSGAIIGSSISEGASEKDFLGMCNGAVEPLF